MKYLMIVALAVPGTLFTVNTSPQSSLLAFSATGDAVPERGSISRQPSLRWEDAFVSGNGHMGAMMFGTPDNEIFVANHCRLFLPLGNREIVPDLAVNVPELRRIIHEKNYEEAMKLFLGKAKDQGYPGLIPTDPYHPGFFINIRQPAEGQITDYIRTENFQTGEVTVRWRDNRGEFRRRFFVSRTDNVIVVSLTGPVASELLFPPVSPEVHSADKEFLGMEEEAYGRLQVMAVKQSMTTSLITSHEPKVDIFNTDCNGGIPQIVNTMLLQSHVRSVEKESQVSKFNFEIDLLPALPKEWPNGKVSGLLTRGGFEVDCTWHNSRLTEVTIRSKRGGLCRICYRNKMITLDTRAGQSYRLNGELKF